MDYFTVKNSYTLNGFEHYVPIHRSVASGHAPLNDTVFPNDIECAKLSFHDLEDLCNKIQTPLPKLL